MAQHPNVVLIMADQHHAGMAGCYGDPLVQTPAIDSLAARGATFDAAYTPSPLCAPARAALLTGCHVHRIEVWDNAAPLRSDWPTFAHSFRGAGYRTILCGKMHFAGPDQLHGFAERWTQDIYPADFRWTHPNRDRVWVPPEGSGQGIHRVHESGVGWTRDMDYDEEVAFRAVQGIRRIGRVAKRRPLFLTVSFAGPHYPFVAPRHYWERYRDQDIDLPELPADHREREHPYVAWFREYAHLDREPVPDEVARRARHATLARVTMIDDYVARVLAALREAGMGDDTLVIYAADHGEMLGEHGLWFKCTGYEGSVRVPLIFAGPGITRRRVAQPVSLLDLGPTLCALAGIPQVYTRHDGADHAPLVTGSGREGSGEAIIEYYGDGTWRGWRSIRRGTHKLLYVPGLSPALYDLASDPGEWHDLAGDPRHAAAVADLTDRVLAGWDPDACDERRYRSEERRLAILGAWGDDPPDWQRPADPLPHPVSPEPR